MARLTTTIVAKKYCLMCVGLVRQDAINCTDTGCAFWPHRPKQRGRVKVGTIRKFCRQCTNNSEEYIKECHSGNCLCYPFRMGKNPNIKLSAEEQTRRRILFAKNKALSLSKTEKSCTSL